MVTILGRSTIQPQEAPEAPEFWLDRSIYHEREIKSITHKLKQFFGGVQDEYDAPDNQYNSATMANKLRKVLQQHRAGLAAAKKLRFPTERELLTSLSHLGPLSRYQKLAYSYDHRPVAK